MPNLVAVRRSCRKKGGTDIHTDTHTHKGTMQLYIEVILKCHFFPDSMKTAKVIPVYKVGNCTAFTNDRP